MRSDVGRSMVGWLMAVLFAVALVAGCTSNAPEPLPFVGGGFGPSRVMAQELDLARLAKTDDCVSCHADVGTHWASSIHGYASFDNPWYRASVDSFRVARGRRESRFCAGCHDPLLLLSGDIDGEVSPENDLAYAGITCLVCHGTEATRTDGNASYSLSSAPVLVPDPADAEEIAEHRAQLTMTPLRSADLCGSCHRSSSGEGIGNPHHLPGIDDLGDWASSAYSGAATWHFASAERQSCQSCHMPSVPASPHEMAGASDGTIRSHRWEASHTAMAAQLGDHTWLDRAQEALQGAVVVDVGAVRTGVGRVLLARNAVVRPSQLLVFDVLLQNASVGHRFPGGIRDLQDSWLEVVVRDANGLTLASSVRDDASDDDVFSLRATVLDADARPERLHRVDLFSTPAFDRTLDAHDARAVRYSMRVPRRVRLPLRVDVRLLHRKHPPDFQRFSCDAGKSERGVAFANGAKERGKVPIDPCLAQPITTVGAATAWIGRGARSRARMGGAARPDVERLLTQGLALLHGTQEHVHLSKPSIELALRLAKLDDDPTTVARAWVLRARLAAVEGRADEAVRFSGRAESHVGPHPVLDRLRGDAYAQVWRWPEAAEWYRRVADASPNDPSAWRDLASAYGSLSRNQDALDATERGLALLPSDERLLRTRALSLRALGDVRAAAAESTWLDHRAPDATSTRLSACEQAYEVCRRDRKPIPNYTLAPATKRFHAGLDPR